MQTQKQSRWVLPVVLLMLFGPILWALTTFMVMSRKAAALDAGCTQNLEQLGRAFQDYAAQHGGKLPDAAHWVDRLQPHLKAPGVLHCPADRSDKRCSYAFNVRLSGKRLSALQRSSEIVLLYETKQPGNNPVGIGKDAVDVGRNTKGRHYRTANRYNYYLMADLAIRRAGTDAEIKKLHWNVAARP